MMKQPQGYLPTLKDIAKKTGYSINTVSRALREKDDIAPETRLKIQRIAQEMGYVNNMLASSLRLGYTKTIAVILGDVSNPHFGIMMKEIESHARGYEYSSFLINTNEDEALEKKAIEDALNKNVDGIILCPVQRSRQNIEYLQQVGVPFVLVGRYFKEIPTDYVVVNDELGGFQATQYLLQQGHQEIVMLHGPLYISSASERLAGYRRAHAEAGIYADPRRICEVAIQEGGSRAVLEGLLEEPVPFTALFAFSDVIAWDTWAVLQEMGYQVPADYSLIGFDHIQSRIRLPFSLSTISTYKGQMSVQAVDTLVERICAYNERNQTTGSEQSEPHTHRIDTNLREGQTVLPR